MASSLQGKGGSPERFPHAALAPSWCAAADRFLSAAAKEIRLLAAITPLNTRAESDRLSRALETAAALGPQWSYPSVDLGELSAALTAWAAEMVKENTALANLYCARANEMALEAELISTVGTCDFPELAARRFVAPAGRKARATQLANEWLRESEADRDTTAVPSERLRDDMKAAVGRLRLPFTVVEEPRMLALAATGESAIYVASDASITARDVERTVLHETLGHALPRHRAASQSVGIFRVGTARGADDQEGYALVLEERHGFLDATRKRELALRHLAAVEMEKGASFHDVVRFVIAHGREARPSIAIASRIFRGSNGVTRGLGRERAYLESYLAVRELFARDPANEEVLASGQIAVDAVPILRDCVTL